MNALEVKIEASNYARATVKLAGPGRPLVALLVDPDVRWDAEGLRKLAQVLTGVAAALSA